MPAQTFQATHSFQQDIVCDAGSCSLAGSAPRHTSSVVATSTQATTTSIRDPPPSTFSSSIVEKTVSRSLPTSLDSTSEGSTPSVALPSPSPSGVPSAEPTSVAPPSTPNLAPPSTSTSAPTPASTPITIAPASTSETHISSPLATSPAVGNNTSTSTHPQTSDSVSPLQPLEPSAASSSASSRSRIPTPALVSAIVCLVLAIAATGVLIRFRVRRRRARLSAQGSSSGLGMPACGSDDTPFTPVLARSRSRAHPNWQADNRYRDESTDTRYRLVSGNERVAQGRSAAGLERAPCLLGSPSAIDADRKDGGYLEQEVPTTPPPILVPPSAEPLPQRSDSPARQYTRQSQATTASAPGLETADGAHGEGLLHLTLPWVYGQRVLAIMAREDARSVDSGGSEPLPAYEPRE
ncbi:hypothetical protein TRAPUB_13234 [Trametes pubescens]|uniref:Uncharacterized protein n=1 Tax=Trametes pubescens TaxID=154538 RepID=A0A1M2VRL3_TRAPU|nr:hypothetical protein TRAPUB_13234 [Trametes pubescens]